MKQENRRKELGSILMLLLPVMIGMVMVVLDNTAITLAISALVEDFHSTNMVIQWVISGYTLAQVAVIPLSGWFTDRFGAKKVFLSCVVLFVAGSTLCAAATTAPMMIMFRILQGLGGGMIMPIAFALSFQVSPPEKVGIVTAMVSVPTMLAPAMGPVIAGWLLTVASWHWIFLINLPLGILAIILGIYKLPKTDKTTQGGKLDKAGMVLVLTGFTLLCYGISEGSNSWRSPVTILCLLLGVTALVVFVFVELHQKEPLWELRVFQSSNFTFSIVTQWINMFLYYGALFLIPLFLQQVAGLSSMETALLMLAQSVCNLVMAPVVGILYDKVGLRPLVTAGLIGSVVAMFLFAHGTTGNLQICFIIGLGLMGIGSAFNQQYNTHLMQVAPRGLAGRVMSLSTSAMQVFSSCAIAVFSTIITAGTNSRMQQGMDPRDSGMAAYRSVFYIVAVCFIVALVCSCFIRRPQIEDGE